jgi:acylphosphatase
MNKSHLDIRVSGHVQGVFFRASAQKQAKSFGLSGFVRNERDGSVYIEAEGSTEALGKFVDWCRVGPPEAVVKSCDVREAPLKNLDEFLIQR